MEVDDEIPTFKKKRKFDEIENSELDTIVKKPEEDKCVILPAPAEVYQKRITRNKRMINYNETNAYLQLDEHVKKEEYAYFFCTCGHV